ncbi:MAG TPA: endopeptidase La [Deltaproteobacteria bacterium]|nr:endopeptidase La [Deltaproteobacteria bacterium]
MSPLPVALPLRGMVVFPGMIRIMPVGRPSSIRAIERHLDEGVPFVMLPQLDVDEDDPLHAVLSTTGVLGRILRLSRLPDGTLRVLVEGVERVRRTNTLSIVGGATVVAIEPIEDAVIDSARLGAVAAELADLYQAHTQNAGLQPHEHWTIAPTPEDPSHLADQVMATTDAPLSEQIALLEQHVLDARLDTALLHLVTQVARQQIAADVNARVQRAMDDSQREYHLKEQLKAIRAELGEASGAEADAATFEDRIQEAGMPEEIMAEALREVERLRRVHTDSAEYTIIRTWLETVCDVPWRLSTSDTTSLKKAQRVLDHDHHGLEFVKERLLEYLAVRQLAPESKGPILCFVGPPGVGKTSLGMSIAKALGRSFGRIALGGVKDETEIRGHRRTYVGALPGRLLRALIRAGTRNPVLVLDELDKVGNDFRGDPASALLEVLDPEQNNAFVDHYLDVPVDLSQVLFIATANLMDPIPPALLDRLEIIEIPGYTEEEKVVISRKHLIPKLTQNHGLSSAEISIETGAIQRAIRDYTREAGLRELERQLARLNRKVARRVVEDGVKKVRIRANQLPQYLGPPRYFQELAELEPHPGVVIGLAWTAAGGDILFVEAARMPGKASMKLTGSLGEVMKESAEAAMSWLRAYGHDYGIDVELFDAEFHLHVPAGAIPKDGPSAGVTMVTALASLVTGRPVRERLAMTGEITLRGKVLPVGGIKEKALAARRAGVRIMLLPQHNRNDLADIPDEIKGDLEFVFIDRIEQVLEEALGLQRLNRTPRAAAAAAPRRASDRAGRVRRR